MKNYDNSLIYKLRLLLVHKDLLRSSLPFVTKRYIKQFRQSQLAAARRLQGKDRIEVAFFLTIPGMWKADFLFRAMQDNPKYHPYVVIYPYSQYKGFEQEEIDATIERTRLFVESKGFEYVIPFDKKKNKWIDIKKTLDPDIIFFSAPYKDHLPQYFIYHFRDRLTCYIPYGFTNFSYLYHTNYDLLFMNLVGCFFLETPAHKLLAEQHSRNKGLNAIVTGYPGTEVFLRQDYKPKDVWKNQEKPKKRVIWAPHHSIEDSFAISTFLLYCDDMVRLAQQYQDQIQFVFKPHQLLKFKLQKIWGEERVRDYYSSWEMMPNTQLEESSYVDLFITSDAMIHDSGSFTTEYIFTQKPVMFLVRSDEVRSKYTPLGVQMFDAHYHAHKVADIEDFLYDVVVEGKDPMAERRWQVFDNYLKPIDGMMPSERIIYEIEKMESSASPNNTPITNCQFG